ncbi:MAG: di-heme enzyme [Labilithrix sp.]
MTLAARTLTLAGVLAASACASASVDVDPSESSPLASNESRELVAVGRRLFFDKQLSWNQRQSCGTCHIPARAFADGLNRAVGSEGDLHLRNTPSIVNLGSYTSLTWLAPGVADLAEQARRPLLGATPIVELGMGGHEDVLVERLRADAYYQEHLPSAFPAATDPFTVANVVTAIAAFERTIVARDAPYDRYLRGDRAALTAEAVRGSELFFGRLGCGGCHGGVDLHEPSATAIAQGAEGGFANNGLYDVDGQGAYPAADPGLRAITGRAEDEGRFRIPSLRNVTVTAPYMHDGSVETLDDVLTAYARGGRELASGRLAGDGARSPRKHPAITGFTLSEEERREVVAFLGSLTDVSFASRPDLTDPFAP